MLSFRGVESFIRKGAQNHPDAETQREKKKIDRRWQTSGGTQEQSRRDAGNSPDRDRDPPPLEFRVRYIPRPLAPELRDGILSGREADPGAALEPEHVGVIVQCHYRTGLSAVMSVTVAFSPAASSTGDKKALIPGAPAPSATRPDVIRSSMYTGQATVLPSGVMVPRSYPVTSKASCADGIVSLFTPTTARSFGHEIWRSPGTSANRNPPS